MWRSLTITKEEPAADDTVMPPVHPGEIPQEEFLAPLGVSQYQLAKAVDVPARRINEIVHGQRSELTDAHDLRGTQERSRSQG